MSQHVGVVVADQLADVEGAILVPAHTVGFVDVVPDRLQFPLVIEDLDAVVLAVADVNVVVLVHDDGVRVAELAWFSTYVVPGERVPTGRCVFPYTTLS